MNPNFFSELHHQTIQKLQASSSPQQSLSILHDMLEKWNDSPIKLDLMLIHHHWSHILKTLAIANDAQTLLEISKLPTNYLSSRSDFNFRSILLGSVNPILKESCHQGSWIFLSNLKPQQCDWFHWDPQGRLSSSRQQTWYSIFDRALQSHSDYDSFLSFLRHTIPCFEWNTPDLMRLNDWKKKWILSYLELLPQNPNTPDQTNSDRLIALIQLFLEGSAPSPSSVRSLSELDPFSVALNFKNYSDFQDFFSSLSIQTISEEFHPALFRSLAKVLSQQPWINSDFFCSFSKDPSIPLHVQSLVHSYFEQYLLSTNNAIVIQPLSSRPLIRI